MFKTVSKPLAHLNFLSGVNCYDIGSTNTTYVALPQQPLIISFIAFILSSNMKFSCAVSIAAVGSASAYSFSGTSLKAATSNGASMQMAAGMGVNGFGRIGRLVTRIIMEDKDCKLAAINAGSATPDYSELSIYLVVIGNYLMHYFV